jgi:hypothetical protein
VLALAGADRSAAFLEVDGADTRAGGTPDFIRSMPMKKALDPSTILALRMNGQPAPASDLEPIGGMPVKSTITSPEDQDSVTVGPQVVRGFAWAAKKRSSASKSPRMAAAAGATPNSHRRSFAMPGGCSNIAGGRKLLTITRFSHAQQIRLVASSQLWRPGILPAIFGMRSTGLV